jgi:alkylation response protein AidB-like acyl-CoA dehydrogenase
MRPGLLQKLDEAGIVSLVVPEEFDGRDWMPSPSPLSTKNLAKAAPV